MKAPILATKSVKNFVNYIKNIIFGASVVTIAIKINLCDFNLFLKISMLTKKMRNK